MGLYLSDYVGRGTRADPFRPRLEGASIDLRPDCTVRDGFALVNADERPRFWQRRLKLGDGFKDTFGPRIRDRAHDLMGVDVSGVKRFDVLAAKLLMQPNGWNPLQPALSRMRYEIWLGGLVWEFPLLSGGASDDFNRPNMTDAYGDPWQVSAAAGDIDELADLVSNALSATGGGVGAGFYINAALTGSQYSEAVLGGRDSGVTVRCAVGTTAFNCYLFEGFAGSFKISKVTNGSLTTVGTTSSGAPGSETRRLEADGSSLTAYRAGAQDGSPQTDTAYTTGQPGVWVSTGGAHTVDSWKGGDLPTVAVSFPIAGAADDGTLYRQAATWAGIGSGSATAEGTAELWLSKVHPTDFFCDNAFVRMDTSSIPDTARIRRMWLKFWVHTKGSSGADAFKFVGDYYDFGGEPSVAADWIETASPNVFEDLLRTALLGNDLWNVVEILERGGLNKKGYTGLRLTLGAGTPTDNNNSVEINGWESGAGQPVVTLGVDYETTTSLWGLLQAQTKPDGGALAFLRNVEAGSLLVVALEVDGAENPNPTTPTDTLGTSYSPLRTRVNSPNGQCVALWAGIAPSSGANTVTAANTTNFDGMVIAEFTYTGGPLTGFTIDDSDDNYLAGPLSAGLDTVSGDAMTPVGADVLALLALGTDSGGGATFADGSNMTMAGQTSLSLSAGDQLVLAYSQVVGTPGSFTPKLSVPDDGTSQSAQILEALVTPVVLPHTGHTNATSASAPAGGGASWSDPTNALEYDFLVASLSMTSGISDVLYISDFGFTIPEGSTIVGVEARVRQTVAGSGTASAFLQLHNGPSNLLGSTKTMPDTPSGAIVFYGGAADLWGATPTVEMVNGPDFGVLCYGTVSSGGIGVDIDEITLDVFYTLGEVGPPQPEKQATVFSRRVMVGRR